MGYGFGIFLVAIGLILIYALEVDIPGWGRRPWAGSSSSPAC